MKRPSKPLHNRDHSIPSNTFRGYVFTLGKAFDHWANRLDRPRYVSNDIKRGRTRGVQKALRWVARELKMLAKQHPTEYGLYKALSEFSECLATTDADAHEEAREFQKRARRPFEQRSAEGEAHVFPRMCARLVEMLAAYIPQEDGFALSPDGKHIVSFAEDEDKPIPVEQKEVSAVMKCGHQRDKWPSYAKSSPAPAWLYTL